jgi:hypothetical protein
MPPLNELLVRQVARSPRVPDPPPTRVCGHVALLGFYGRESRPDPSCSSWFLLNIGTMIALTSNRSSLRSKSVYQDPASDSTRDQDPIGPPFNPITADADAMDFVGVLRRGDRRRGAPPGADRAPLFAPPQTPTSSRCDRTPPAYRIRPPRRRRPPRVRARARPTRGQLSPCLPMPHLHGPGDFYWHEIPRLLRQPHTTSANFCVQSLTKIDQELAWRPGGPRACLETQFLQID